MADPNKPDPAPANAAAAAASQTGVRTDAARRGDDARRSAQDRNRDQVARERDERDNRPQDAGGKPTPTQQENDEIRNGIRHIDDKEDDGSGPDRFAGRNLRADQARGYETR